jgi:hypothetical protein
MSEQIQLTESNKCYDEQMQSWLKEQEAREKQILVTIETSGEIVRQNEIQLQWHMKAYAAALAEYNEWRKEKGLDAMSTPPGSTF